jgi:predicted helicase
MYLHINYETVEPYDLKVINKEPKPITKEKELFHKQEEPEALFKRQPKIKAILRADKDNGLIILDEITTIEGIPSSAWEYKLGNRSAIEWILDQYKEKKPKDPTIAEKFNTYRFADYKDQVIDLIKRVCTVSVETMKIVKEMEIEKE